MTKGAYDRFYFCFNNYPSESRGKVVLVLLNAQCKAKLCMGLELEYIRTADA